MQGRFQRVFAEAQVSGVLASLMKDNYHLGVMVSVEDHVVVEVEVVEVCAQVLLLPLVAPLRLLTTVLTELLFVSQVVLLLPAQTILTQ